MTLRNKTLLFISLTLAALIIVLYSISRTTIHRGFTKVEKDLVKGFSTIEVEDARRNVSRVTDALKMKVDNLSVKATDWAQWDDTYKFIIDKNKAFAESNLNADALLALKINFILMFNAKGEMVVGVALDLDKGEMVPLPESLKNLLKPGSPLIKRDSAEDVISGILLLRENPLMFVSRPILKSDGSGAPRGALLFARYLDDVEFDNLASITHLALTRYRADASSLPADFTLAQPKMTEKSPVFINPLDEKTISGYTRISDAFEKTALFLRVDIPRDIHKQGRHTVAEIRKRGQVTLLSMVVSILAAGIVLGLVILFILEKLVLSRIGRLSGKTVEIGTTGDFSARVEEEGRDEIYSLAASINKMLSALSQTHQAIEIKEREMRMLMNTIPAGILSLDEKFNVNPEYSSSAKQMIGQGRDLKALSFADALGLSGARGDDGKKLVDYLDMLRQELASESTMAELNPFNEIKMAGVEPGLERWLRIRFFLIHRGKGLLHHILVVLEDITEEKKLAHEVAKSHKENMQLKAIAEDPDLFREFLIETRNILRHVHAMAQNLTPGSSDPAPVDEIFRGVHTIKGVSGSFGLFQVAEMAGQLEDSLEPLRAGGALSAGQIDSTNASLKNLEACYGEVAESAKKFLGDEIEGAGIFLRIPLDELKKHMREIRDMDIDASLKDKILGRMKEDILLRLQQLSTIPARKGFARSIKVIPGLIERLNKNIRFTFEGQETPIDCEIAHELNTPLIHLLRNACDHGIESPEERAEKNKPEAGEIKLAVNQAPGTLTLTLTDDGAGLDPEKLKTAAFNKGIITQEELKFLNRERCFALIFRPGFSTAEKISDVSGRGVGMDAVLQSIRGKLKGEIEVDSKTGAGTSFTIKIPA